MQRYLWTPGQWTMHRVLTAALLAFWPPDASLGFQAAYWVLLLVYAISRRFCLWAMFAALVGWTALIWSGQVTYIPVTLAAIFLARGLARLGPSKDSLYELTLLTFSATILFFFGIFNSWSWSDSYGLFWLLSFGWVFLGMAERARFVAWCGLHLLYFAVLWRLAGLTEGSAHEVQSLILYTTFPVLAFSPRWIARRKRGLPLTVYYDGECGFCHRGVQYLLKEDPAGEALRFAPLQGESFTTAIAGIEPADVPESIVVRDADGARSFRSAAALRICAALGGYWRPLGALGWLVPRPLRDAAYDFVARRRKRWFAKPEGHCPLLSADQRARFDP
ncbi:MAG: DCC1-like thiol-disulfide oxidoreductase family protein [Planctomycetota bacterium]|nr:DCC1-like thiol-disulfide oxidoreductase family protein [Planctomycetota bacterium]